MLSAVRDFRAGAREFFVSGRPGPKTAPAKDAARARIIELRAAGHSIDEIGQALAAEGTPLNRTSVGEILAEEGFGRLLRHREPEASISPGTAGRDADLPTATVIRTARLADWAGPMRSPRPCRG